MNVYSNHDLVIRQTGNNIYIDNVGYYTIDNVIHSNKMDRTLLLSENPDFGSDSQWVK